MLLNCFNIDNMPTYKLQVCFLEVVEALQLFSQEIGNLVLNLFLVHVDQEWISVISDAADRLDDAYRCLCEGV